MNLSFAELCDDVRWIYKTHWKKLIKLIRECQQKETVITWEIINKKILNCAGLLKKLGHGKRIHHNYLIRKMYHYLIWKLWLWISLTYFCEVHDILDWIQNCSGSNQQEAVYLMVNWHFPARKISTVRLLFTVIFSPPLNKIQFRGLHLDSSLDDRSKSKE